MNAVKIIGAGSAGNHHAHAARSLGLSVDLCDADADALERTREHIYPGRYGRWDEAIRLFGFDEAPDEGYDLICIATPPESHIALALAALDERPGAVMVEKPLCGPDMDGLEVLRDRASAAGIPVFVGYDHVVGKASREVERQLRTEEGIGPIVTIDVEFREHWSGIFAAHPWLDGPADSYLGYWRRGGGASGEHSHAINLWQHFARVAGAGRVADVTAMLDYVDDGTVSYDRLAAVNLRTDTGMVGRVVQDVVRKPPRKWARLHGENGSIEWFCGYAEGLDAISVQRPGAEPELRPIPKTRPDDFIGQLAHIRDALDAGTAAESPIRLSCGAATIRVIAAVHRSAAERRAITLDEE